MMNRVIISVGSNIEPLRNIESARVGLAERFTLIAVSEFFWTKPKGYTDQPDFLNGAFYIETELSQDELSIELKGIESAQGRIRTENRNGPRTIDLDIVVFNDQIVDDDYDKYSFVKEAVQDIIGQIGRKIWTTEIRVKSIKM